MADLALDATTGDLVVDNGDLVIVQGAAAIAQDANLRVALFKGEWPLDTRVGIDYQRLFFDRRPPDAVIRAVYDQVLRETAGVERVERLALSFARATRALTVRATLRAQTGDAVLVYRDILLDIELPQATNATASSSLAQLIGSP